MPRTVNRCLVHFTLKEVTAPGVRLPCRENVYLSISLFGQYHTTQFMPPDFPLLVYETLRFEKTFYSALDIGEVAEHVNDELIIFELVQLSEYTDGAARLASFSTRMSDFVHPFPSAVDQCSSAAHEIMLTRTIAFSGISPKLSFSTRTVVKESLSPELDMLMDAFEEEKERRIFLKTHRAPTERVRSAESTPASGYISVLSYIPSEEDPSPRYCQHAKSSLSHCQAVSLPSCVADINLSNTEHHKPDLLKGGLIRHVPQPDQDNLNFNASKGNKSKSKKHKKKKKSKKSKSYTDIASAAKVGPMHSCADFHNRCPCGDWCAWCFERSCNFLQACCRCTFDCCTCCNRCRRCCQQHHAFCCVTRYHPGEMCCPYTKMIHASHCHQPVHVYITDEEDDISMAYRTRSVGASARFRPRNRYYAPNMPAEMPYYMPIVTAGRKKNKTHEQ